MILLDLTISEISSKAIIPGFLFLLLLDIVSFHYASFSLWICSQGKEVVDNLTFGDVFCLTQNKTSHLQPSVRIAVLISSLYDSYTYYP